MKKIRIRQLLSIVFVLSTITMRAEIVTVDGVKYSLSGAYASVYGVDQANTSTKIVIPSSIKYEGLNYIVNKIGHYAFLYDDELIVSSWDLSGGVFYGNKNVKKVILPPTIKIIDSEAFYNSRITSIIIPKSVEEFGTYPFYGCSMLRTIVYLGDQPPLRWVASSNTYVPNKTSYSKPYQSINNANISEIITFKDDSFDYTGKAPNPNWVCNIDDCEATIALEDLEYEVGTYVNDNVKVYQQIIQ